MSYRLFAATDATAVGRGGGTLGLEVGRVQQITDGGLTFDIMAVRAVQPGSPAQRAGLAVGDDVIAVDGRVFPDIRAFAAYVGSKRPGEQISLDYIPRGGGPQQAQRVAIAMGFPGRTSSAEVPVANKSTGMSTGEKLAIGAGAVALIGCYEMGCFRHRAASHAPQAAAPR